MKPTLTVIDEFLPDPNQVRDRVVASEFGKRTGPDGETYSGISVHNEPEIIDRIREYIGREVEMKMAFFRVDLKNELPHCWVHSDNICAEFAGILYLNPPDSCSGGTAFWRHRTLRIDAMPTEGELSLITSESRNDFEKRIGEEWKRLGAWDMVGFVGMKFNRFAIYPTRCFHSRYPFEGYGTTPQNGRLVFVCFFNIK